MLTDTAIRKATEGRMADGRGLYLQVTPVGSKLWRWKYRYQGREKLMSFGQYPDVPLASARALHSEARKVLASGVDPMAARKAARVVAAKDDVSSFQAVAALWLDHWKVDKSAQHIGATESRLKANVYPSIGARPIAEIETPEIVGMVKTIEKRGVGDVAKRAMQTTGQIFRYAIAHGYAKRNPVADIKPADVLRPTVKVNLARIPSSELCSLLKAIEVYEGKPLTRLATKLMALTFVRTSELIGARWNEIRDLIGRFGEIESKRWVIPAERMKMRCEHIVPLSTQAIEILELIRGISGDGEVMFPGEQGGTMSNNTILFALKRMGYGGQMTGHGFRGLASTLLHEQGWPHEHIELQLAHAPRNAVSAAYNHALYLEPRAKMMQHWGDFLEMTQRGK